MPRSEHLPVELTSTEREHGLTYVALTRSIKFSNIGLKDGISKNRLCVKIKNQAKMKKRILEEKRLKTLELLTLDFAKKHMITCD